jgi:hypothetical protein
LESLLSDTYRSILHNILVNLKPIWGKTKSGITSAIFVLVMTLDFEGLDSQAVLLSVYKAINFVK